MLTPVKGPNLALYDGSRGRTRPALITRLGAFCSDTGTNLADLRQGLVRARTEAIDQMLQRAVDRGEVLLTV